MKKRIQCVSLATLLLLGGGWLFLSQTVYASTTVTVNGTGDLSDLIPGDGACDTLGAPGNQCSLRAAIEELNAQGPDITPHRIEFDLSGPDPISITLDSELPEIVVPVEIDGETQPGAACPTSGAPANLLVVLNGSQAGLSASGLTFAIGSEGSGVRGLVVGNFDSAGIELKSDDNAVRCMHIGVAADGATPMTNGIGILVSSDNNIIGGQNSHGRRNVISANDTYGVYISGASNFVANNFVGTTADGLNALGNLEGVVIQGSGSVNNQIGGPEPLARNVVAASVTLGIGLIGENNTVLGNLIGVGRDGVTPLPNNVGVDIQAEGNVVGGVAPGEPNLIAYNEAVGIRIWGNGTVENQIRGNSIRDNDSLGIDLGWNGVDVNDAGDVDTGPNNYQNYPALQSISDSNILSATLESAANTLYIIDFYRNDNCDPTGYGEGQELVYSDSYMTDASGKVVFSLDAAFWNISPGDYLTATATDPDGNTSEFSACLPLPAPGQAFIPAVFK